MMSNVKKLDDPKLPKFLEAVRQGGIALRADPKGMWQKFIADQTTLNDKLDQTAWFQSIPYFAKNPSYLDEKRYSVYRDFMFAKGMIKKNQPLSDYAVQIIS